MSANVRGYILRMWFDSATYLLSSQLLQSGCNLFITHSWFCPNVVTHETELLGGWGLFGFMEPVGNKRLYHQWCLVVYLTSLHWLLLYLSLFLSTLASWISFVPVGDTHWVKIQCLSKTRLLQSKLSNIFFVYQRDSVGQLVLVEVHTVEVHFKRFIWHSSTLDGQRPLLSDVCLHLLNIFSEESFSCLDSVSE